MNHNSWAYGQPPPAGYQSPAGPGAPAPGQPYSGYGPPPAGAHQQQYPPAQPAPGPAQQPGTSYFPPAQYQQQQQSQPAQYQYGAAQTLPPYGTHQPQYGPPQPQPQAPAAPVQSPPAHTPGAAPSVSQPPGGTPVSPMPPYGAPLGGQPAPGAPQQATYGSPPPGTQPYGSPPPQQPQHQPYSPQQAPGYQPGVPGAVPQGGMYPAPPIQGQPAAYGYPPRNPNNPMSRIGRLGGDIGGKLTSKLTSYMDHLTTHTGSNTMYVRPGQPVYQYGPPVGVPAYGAQPQYGAQPAYGAPPTQYGAPPAQYGAQPAPYGAQPAPAPQPAVVPQPGASQPGVHQPGVPQPGVPQPGVPQPAAPPVGDAPPPAYSSQPSTPAGGPGAVPAPSQPTQYQHKPSDAASLHSPASTTAPERQAIGTPPAGQPPAPKPTQTPPVHPGSTAAVPSVPAVAAVASILAVASTPPTTQASGHAMPAAAAPNAVPPTQPAAQPMSQGTQATPQYGPPGAVPQGAPAGGHVSNLAPYGQPQSRPGALPVYSYGPGSAATPPATTYQYGQPASSTPPAPYAYGPPAASGPRPGSGQSTASVPQAVGVAPKPPANVMPPYGGGVPQPGAYQYGPSSGAAQPPYSPYAAPQQSHQPQPQNAPAPHQYGAAVAGQAALPAYGVQATQPQPAPSGGFPVHLPHGSKFGSLSGLADKLENMVLSHKPSIPGHGSVSGHGHTHLSPRGDYDEHPMLTTPIKDASAPEEISRICLRYYDLDFETTWYFLSSAPNFMICTWCHHHYIAESSLASSFDSVRKKGMRCLFHVPRITKRLWREAPQTGNLVALADFMEHRAGLPHCKGMGGAVVTDNIKWFGSSSQDIPGFKACETCYESILLGTSFADRFSPLPAAQAASERWVCSLAYKYVERAVLRYSINPNPQAGWAEFVSAASKRLGLPKCDEQPVVANTLIWYQPQSHPELRFCEACFLDELGLTPFATCFATYDPDHEEDIVKKFEPLTCNLNHASVKELAFVSIAGRRSLDEFKAHLSNVLSKPRCSNPEGIKGGRWHNFAHGPAANYDVCEGCIAGVVAPHGMQRFYTSAPLAAGSQDIRFCDFYPSSVNYSRFNFRFIEAVATGNFSAYRGFVQKWAPILTCPGDELVADRVWYGWEELPVCLECFETFAAGTARSPSRRRGASSAAACRAPAPCPPQKTHRVAATGCALYSPRMREKYTAACASGNTEELLKFSRERWVVYHETVPKMKLLLDKAKAESDHANINLIMSNNYLGMDTMTSAIGSTDLEWDPATGSYRSSARKASDQAWEKGMQGYERARDPKLWQEAQELEKRWKEVE